MTSLLEERYRRALRMLPKSYRAQWEEDMVATYLQSAYAASPDDPEAVEISSPARSELTSIAALAVRLRLGGVDAPADCFAWGEAVRRVALIGLLAQAMTVLVGLGFMVWLTLRLPGLPTVDESVTVGRPPALWNLVGLLWLPAYLCLVLGYRSPARVLAGAALAGLIMSNVVDLTGNNGAFGLSRAYLVLFQALLVLALAAFHRSAPPVRARPWLLALPIGAVAAFAVLLAGQAADGLDPLVDLPGLWCVGLTVAAGVHLTWIARNRGGTSPSADGLHWSLALALLAVGAFGLRVLTLTDYLTYAVVTPNHVRLVTVDVVQSTAILIAAVSLATYVVRAWPRLPTTDPTADAATVAAVEQGNEQGTEQEPTA